MKIEEIKQIVKERYGKCADKGGGKESCCCPSEAPTSSSFVAEHGLYGQKELSLIPEIALNLSKGCGNPTGFANLQPGGRLAISDIVLTEKIEPQVQECFQSTWAGCVGGAIEEDSYFAIVRKVGFRQFEVVTHHPLSPKDLEAMACCPGPEFTPTPSKEDIASVTGKVISIKFTAVKPLLS